jgi:hypothetical protein
MAMVMDGSATNDELLTQTPELEQLHTTSSTALAFDMFPSCNRTSLELSQVSSEDIIEPCLLYDIHVDHHHDNHDGDVNDAININSNSTGATATSTNTTTTEIVLVQVTPSTCRDHRDGAATAVQKLNHYQGVEIGFYQRDFVTFRLVSVVAGNPSQMASATEYSQQHAQALETLLQHNYSSRTDNDSNNDSNVISNSTRDVFLGPHYIIGSCSFGSASQEEKRLAQQYKRILTAQIGPPSYYAEPDQSEVSCSCMQLLMSM